MAQKKTANPYKPPPKMKQDNSEVLMEIFNCTHNIQGGHGVNMDPAVTHVRALSIATGSKKTTGEANGRF